MGKKITFLALFAFMIAFFACVENKATLPVPQSAVIKTLTVRGISCSKCKYMIEKKLMETEGVYEPFVDMNKEKQNLTFYLDEEKTKLSIVESLIIELGFIVYE